VAGPKLERRRANRRRRQDGPARRPHEGDRLQAGREPRPRLLPGAYYSKLTKSVICSAGFHTGDVRDVPESEKFAVEREYGLAPGHYGRTFEIDHLVSLELGGSNQVKDRLENRLHDLVCAGSMRLRVVQREMAWNWQGLYKRVYGVAPAD
jgi:hypothetical protein